MRIIVGMSGASGAIYGIRLLEALNQLGVESHLILTEWARKTIELETEYTPGEVEALASHVHSPSNLAAAVSSGSFPTNGMVIAPCSMKTLAGIAAGFADNLLIRAADVTLKEKRPLLLVARETPLHVIHLENMLKVARAGATVVPPMPAFYNKPQTVDDIVGQTVGRLLDLLGIGGYPSVRRWQGLPERDEVAR